MARTKQTARRSTLFNAQPTTGAATVDTLWPVKEGPSPMTTLQQAQIVVEDRYRDLFANNRGSSELSDPHVLLRDVFDNHSSLVYQSEDEDEAQVPKILTSERVLGRSGPCFATKQQFLNNWAKFTNGILSGLNWDNVFAAGGSVLANATAHNDPSHFASSDIDLFVYGFDTDDQANKKLEHIFEVVSKNSVGVQIVRSFRAVTILGTYPDYRHVQIILRLYKSAAEVLLAFDVDCCTVGFDGTTVWAMDRCVRAVSKGYNLVNISRRSLSYETRLRKYSKRGYAVAVPNLDKAQVDVSLFQKSAADVQGLAKLLIYEYYDRNPPTWGSSVRSYSTHKIIPRRFLRQENRSGNMNQDNIDIVHDITGQEDSDYAEFIPWGPAWYSGTIINMLQYKDRAATFGGKQARKPQPAASGRGKSEPVHHHSYVTGIEGVIQGHSVNYWCRFCRQKKPLEQTEDGKDVVGPLHWMNENQVLQDLDRGFRRSFAGSFQPVLREDWSEGVYAPGYQPRDSPHPLTQGAGIGISFGSTARTISSTPISTDAYVSGGQRFESQNQMLRHMRENAQSTSDSRSPYGTDVDAFNGKPSVDNVKAFGGGTLPFFTTTVSDSPSRSTVVRNLNVPSSPAVVSTYGSQNTNNNNNNINTNNNYTYSNNNNNNNNSVSYDSKPARAIPPTWWNLFGKGAGSADTQMSYTSQALLLVAALYRKGAITFQVKASLKDLILQNDPLVKSVVEAFFIDSDLVEVVDSFTRVLEISKKY